MRKIRSASLVVAVGLAACGGDPTADRALCDEIGEIMAAMVGTQPGGFDGAAERAADLHPLIADDVTAALAESARAAQAAGDDYDPDDGDTFMALMTVAGEADDYCISEGLT